VNKNKEAKLSFINSFHDEADKRIEFLLQLYAETHRQEALTLCLNYIDSFSQWLQWPSTNSGENFVKAVASFGGDSVMGLVHPLQAVRGFNRLNPYWEKVANEIESIYPGPSFELQTEDDFIDKLTPHFSTVDLKEIRPECWRATLAATAYFHLRNPSIHEFGALELSFSNTTYQGSKVLGIDFMRLHRIATRLHGELRRRSEISGQWFGNDKIVFA